MEYDTITHTLLNIPSTIILWCSIDCSVGVLQKRTVTFWPPTPLLYHACSKCASHILLPRSSIFHSSVFNLGRSSFDVGYINAFNSMLDAYKTVVYISYIWPCMTPSGQCIYVQGALTMAPHVWHIVKIGQSLTRYMYLCFVLKHVHSVIDLHLIKQVNSLWCRFDKFIKIQLDFCFVYLNQVY